MSEKKAKMPQIRFTGFTDAWEQRKAEKIFKTISEKGYMDLPVLSASQELGMIRRDEIGIDIKYDEKSIINYKLVKPGQFVIHLRSFQGGFAWSDIEGITSPAYTVLDFVEQEEHDSKFWKKVLTSSIFIKRLETVTYGIRDGRSISFTDFSMLKFNVPSIEEQREIGKFFDKVDNLITLHQRELDLLKETKKAMLQKMFPKDGSNIPEIRFAGFTDAWEQRKVNELCSISTGKSNTQDKIEDGNYPFYVRSPIIERSTKYLYDEEAVITVGDGVGTGKVFHYVNGKYDLHQRCYRMYDFTYESNAHYFYHAFSKLFFKRVMAMTAKTSVDSVRLEMIADMEIPTPSIEEQIKVGTYFDNLDNLITLHQRELDTLKNLKKSLLQKMFI